MQRLLLLLLLGCGGARPPPVEVVRTEENIDLSGDWNDVDADTVAAAMIEDCLESTWPESWSKDHGRKPVVRLHAVKNKTDGYIDYRYFTKQLEAALLRSGRVEVVSSLEEAAAARAERDDQAEHAGDETAKTHQNETGSDFILTGWILSQGDRQGSQEVKSYLTSLELVETETQKKAWVGQKRIKKLIKKPASSES
jgi:PBP1b-binding outer membrane lipoprotein LpoB